MEAEPLRTPPAKKPLDPLVKTALTLCLSLIVITVVGMILTAPDRSIPPYSVVAQQGEMVTVSVPPRTTETEIEALLIRFRVVGTGDRNDFARLKIKPTTPEDPSGRYQRVAIYVFDNVGLAEEPSLREYLLGADPTARGSFERGVRGVYRVTPETEFGALGFVPEESVSAQGFPAGSRVLFRGTIGEAR
jgi:hypothetical protein